MNRLVNVSALGLGSLLLGGVFMTLMGGCNGKNLGSAARPKEMTANEALNGGSEVKCSASDDDKTLIVDLDATDRKAIEEMINARKTVPVVGYDCKTLKVLTSCKLEAEFDYIGTSSRENVIEIENFDAVSASIPLASANLKASVQSGRKMAIALAEVGSRNSALELVARPQLSPLRKGDCDGASHFIYRVDVGAFAIAQTTSGEAAAAVEVFNVGASGESKDARSSSKKEGSLDACKKSSDDDKGAPGDCSVPLRVYMRKLFATAEEKAAAEEKAEKDEEESVFKARIDPPCPPGLVRSEEGSCVAPSPGIRYQCRPDDLDECKDQCDKGHTGSCTRLGRMYLFGSPPNAKNKIERDPALAVEALEKACFKAKNRPEGCSSLPDALSALTHKDPSKADAHRSKAESALKFGCERGDALTCAAWGRFYEFGNRTLASNADPERGVRYYVRACGLGDQGSCIRAGTLYVEGSKKPDGTEVFKKIPAEGLALLDRSCKQGSSRSCEQISVYLTSDKFKVKDEKRAAGLFDELCKKNNKVGCAEYALLQVGGQGGVKKAPEEARKTLEDLCYDGRITPACYGIALLAEQGLGGVTKNPSKAAEYYAKSAYVKDGALRLARLLEAGKGVPADLPKAARYYGVACQRPAETDAAVCKKAGEIHEKASVGSPFQVASYFRRACDMAPWDKPTCDKAKELSKPAGKGPPPPKK